MPSSKGDVQSVLSKLRNRKKDPLEFGTFDDFPEMKPVGLTTGNLTLDAVTGIGGVPKGRITEMVGPPSSGKTTAAIQTAAKVQESGGLILYLDFEKTMDPDYCQALGLNVFDADTFIYAKPRSFEEGANTFREIQDELGGVGASLSLVVHDSVAAMVTEHELAAKTGQVEVADRAKKMHQYCRQINHMLSETGCAAIFINHLTEVIDASFAGRQAASRGIKKKTSPGGQALPYYASLRLEFQQMGIIRDDKYDLITNEKTAVASQTKSKVTAIKNKVSDPFRQAELRVRYGRGFSQEYSVFSLLESHNVIKKSGAWFKFPEELALDDDHHQFQGEDSVLSYMEENPEWLERLLQRAQQIIDTHGVDAMPIDESAKAETRNDELIDGDVDLDDLEVKS